MSSRVVISLEKQIKSSEIARRLSWDWLGSFEFPSRSSRIGLFLMEFRSMEWLQPYVGSAVLLSSKIHRSRRRTEVAWMPVVAWHFSTWSFLLLVLEAHQACEPPSGTCWQSCVVSTSQTATAYTTHWTGRRQQERRWQRHGLHGKKAPTHFISHCGHQKSQNKQRWLDELDELTCLFRAKPSTDSHWIILISPILHTIPSVF